MPDELILRAKARERLQAGTLPRQHVSRTFGGDGCGAPCAVCEAMVTRSQLELEVKFHQNGSAEPGTATYHFHMRCFAAWEFEFEHPKGKDASGSASRA
jgi:hypothetical protein